MQLIKDIESPARSIKVHHGIMRRMGREAEVQSALDSVEHLDFFITDRSQREIMEDLTAGTRILAKIFMSIGLFISLLQAFSLKEKLFTEPMPGNAAIIAMMCQPGLRRVIPIFMNPALAALWRIIAVEHPISVSTTQQRLVDGSNVLNAELVSFLIPHEFKKALAESQRLNLNRVISAPEYDLLPCRSIDDLHWRYTSIEQVRHAQLVNCPLKRLVYRLAQGVLDLTKGNSVGVRVLDEAQDNLSRRKR